LPAIAKELTVWIFLGHTAPSIAAGILFRHVALLWPASLVTEEMASVLDGVATLIDYRFRLANDLSDLRGETGFDRDNKPNAWSVLVPAGAHNVEAANAIIEAITLCRAILAWIDQELAQALAALDRVWPTLACIVRRGILVGALVYKRGHFATASWPLMCEVFLQVEGVCDGAASEMSACRGRL